ncbi:thioredoxin [Lojkania enalia]|uniref:Thioredoxin n=1 Tax=Lojkania enalia TaxID=147567 RepID=A0A9P4N338_9PLEO|nr:thioredoxin [Didymosphaeria enalia]
MPTEITAPLHLHTLLTTTTFVVADFYATWCPPCKAIAPIFAQLAAQHSVDGKLAFVKVNVDEQREVAAQYGISAMPTFLLFREGKVVEMVRGADPGKLKRIVAECVEEVRAAEKVGEKVEEKGKEEKTVSGSYGMTGGSNWKMSLH